MTTITAFDGKTPPNRERPSTFSADSDTWFAAEQDFAAQVNTVAGEINAAATAAAGSATQAATQKDAAAASAAAAAASLASITALTGLPVFHVTGTSQAITQSGLYLFEAGASSTATLPAAPTDGMVAAFEADNNRDDNYIDPNGKSINGDTSVIRLDIFAIALVYRAATNQWRIML